MITEYLWKVTGDGYFFRDFYVPAETHSKAMARAQDILAGCTAAYAKDGKRFYGTVDTHVKSITQTQVVVKHNNRWNYHDTSLVAPEPAGQEMT